MNKVDSVLVTGATGLVGGGLVSRLLAAGAEVTAVVRARDDASARSRMLAVLDEERRLAGRTDAPTGLDRLHVVCADISDRASLMDGLADTGDIDCIYHSAACVNFVDSAQCRCVNVGGTRNVLELAGRLKPRSFNHISTAFIAGGFDGTVLEDEMPPRKSLNAYEDTKYEAELLVRGQDDIPYTILRPSIIVGNGCDGRIRTFKNFYLIVRYFARHARMKRPPLRFPGAGTDRINLVPIDFVVDAVLKAGSLPSTGKTYNVVNDLPPTTRDIVEAIEEAVGSRCVEFSDDAGEPGEEELATQARFREFMPYFFGSPGFELASIGDLFPDLSCSRLSADALVRIAAYYVEKELR